LGAQTAVQDAANAGWSALSGPGFDPIWGPWDERRETMIIERITWVAKVGHCAEVVKLLKDMRDFTEQLGIGGKEMVACNSSWSNESWTMFGIEEFPDIEAVQRLAEL
jgi:hypothetical protein